MASYGFGVPVKFTATYPADPTELNLKFLNPLGTESFVSFSSGQITRLSLGVYTYTMTPRFVGKWFYIFIPVGFEAPIEKTFTVLPTAFKSV